MNAWMRRGGMWCNSTPGGSLCPPARRLSASTPAATVRAVSTRGRFLTRLVVAVTLSLVGSWLWGLHASAWGLGRRSPVLNYDTAQYALAGRELATQGHLATTFALPLELSRHP